MGSHSHQRAPRIASPDNTRGSSRDEQSGYGLQPCDTCCGDAAVINEVWMVECGDAEWIECDPEWKFPIFWALWDGMMTLQLSSVYQNHNEHGEDVKSWYTLDLTNINAITQRNHTSGICRKMACFQKIELEFEAAEDLVATISEKDEVFTFEFKWPMQCLAVIEEDDEEEAVTEEELTPMMWLCKRPGEDQGSDAGDGDAAAGPGGDDETDHVD